MTKLNTEYHYFHPNSQSEAPRLRYCYWSPPNPPRATLLLVGGRTEFIEKHLETAQELVQRGFAVWSMDWRGQGGSSRHLSNPHKGHIRNFQEYLSDLDRFLTTIALPRSQNIDLCLGHSMGGHLLLRYLLHKTDTFRACVLVSPMAAIHFKKIPEEIVFRVLDNLCKTGKSEAYAPGLGDLKLSDCRFEGNPLTSHRRRYDEACAWMFEKPVLGLGGPTNGWMVEAIKSMRFSRKRTNLNQISTPILLVSARDDTVVEPNSHLHVARHLPNCELLRLYGAKHEILHEIDSIRTCFWRAFDRFTETHLGL